MFTLTVDDTLKLCLFELRHAQPLFELTVANRAHLAPYLPWAEKMDSVSQTEAFIKLGLEQFAKNDGFQAGIWQQGKLVGACGLHYIRWNTKRTEIGYWLAEGAQGQGIVTKVCAFLCAYAFGELALNRVEIRCASSNTKSRAVPERLGFKEEGTLRQMDKLPSGWADWVVYGLLADEWRQRQAQDRATMTS